MFPGTTLGGLITSPFIIVLLVTGFILFIVAFERYSALRKVSFDEEKVLRKIGEEIKNGSIESAIKLCDYDNSSLTRVLKDGLEVSSLSREDVYDALEKAQIKEKGILETRVALLSTIAFIAPLLGLLGTVVGIIQAFSAMAAAGGADPAAMMAGVGVALLTTAIGIILAVPAAILFGLFSGKVDSILQRIEIASKRLVILLSETKKGKF